MSVLQLWFRLILEGWIGLGEYRAFQAFKCRAQSLGKMLLCLGLEFRV